MTISSLKGLAASRLLSSAFAQAKAPSLESIAVELAGKKVFRNDGAAVKVSFSENAFRNNLEKHIDDYSKGKGNLSKRIAGIVQQEHSETATNLNAIHPRAARAYSGYSSSFSYGSNSRFKAGVSDVTRDTQTIKDVYAKEAQYKEYYENLFASKEAAEPEES